MDLNYINLEDIKEKLLSIDKKTLIKYGSVVGAVILFLIIYYAILNPLRTLFPVDFGNDILAKDA